MPRQVPPLALSEDQLERIEQWLSAQGTPQQVGLRCRIILYASQGETESSIAAKLEINRKTVRLWRERFTKEGLGGLWEIAAGRGRKPIYDKERVQAVIETTLQSKPKGSTHWSCRTMAANQGMSKSTVNNVWRSHNLKPHRTKTFKLSRDPKFLEKLTDVVGLYLNPPDKAIVLCVDERSQIQALDRTRPGLPLKKGRCGTVTHNYKRNGTTRLSSRQSRISGPFGTKTQSRLYGWPPWIQLSPNLHVAANSRKRSARLHTPKIAKKVQLILGHYTSNIRECGVQESIHETSTYWCHRKEIVKNGLEQGHEITALVRDPSKLAADDPKLYIVVGDVLNPADVEAATVGQER